MRHSANDLRGVLFGRDVLAVLALMVLAAGATAAGPVHLGMAAAAAAGDVLPAVASGAAFDLVVVAVVYLQALAVALCYRALRGGYRALQERTRRTGSA